MHSCAAVFSPPVLQCTVTVAVSHFIPPCKHYTKSPHIRSVYSFPPPNLPLQIPLATLIAPSLSLSSLPIPPSHSPIPPLLIQPLSFLPPHHHPLGRSALRPPNMVESHSGTTSMEIGLSLVLMSVGVI